MLVVLPVVVITLRDMQNFNFIIIIWLHLVGFLSLEKRIIHFNTSLLVLLAGGSSSIPSLGCSTLGHLKWSRNINWWSICNEKFWYLGLLLSWWISQGNVWVPVHIQSTLLLWEKKVSSAYVNDTMNVWICFQLPYSLLVTIWVPPVCYITPEFHHFLKSISS